MGDEVALRMMDESSAGSWQLLNVSRETQMSGHSPRETPLGGAAGRRCLEALPLSSVSQAASQNTATFGVVHVQRFLLAVTVCCLLSEVNLAPADELWTGWLGPRRNGWVADFTPPKAWPKTLQKQWEISVGSGYGTPLIADGLIYVHARQDRDEVVLCIDADSGSIKWSRNQPMPFQMGGGGEWHGKGPKSCPFFDNGRLFTMSITGVLTARDAESGDQIWQRDYSSKFAAYKKPTPYWGSQYFTDRGR